MLSRRCFETCVVAWIVSLSLASAEAVEVTPPSAMQGIANASACDRAIAEKFVQAALRAEIAGRDSERATLLRQALRAAPDYPPAHWHAGHVWIDGQWLALSQVASAAPPTAVVDRYHVLAQCAPHTVKDQLKLANWCRDAGLTSYERTHLWHAFALRPGLPEAVERLHLGKYRGVWMPTAEVERRERAARVTASWNSRIGKIRDDFVSRDPVRRSSARQQLAAILDVRSAPSLEAKLSYKSREAALASVEVLTRLPQQQATASLARLSVLSPWPDVRDAAAKALRPRSLFSYAPLLLDGLRAPIEMNVSSYARYGGAATHRLELFQEGPFVDQSLVATTHVRPEIGGGPTQQPVTSAGATDDAESFVSMTATSESLSDAFLSLQAAAQDTTRIGDRIARSNAATRELNERIASALSATTGQTCSSEPRVLWHWWCDYNELYVPPHKPLYEETREYVVKYPTRLSVGVGQAAGTTVQLPVISCFLAGTRVWTEGGTRAIETIRVGDSVLAQDVETGELAFKPVLATTVRPRSPVLTVSWGGESVGVTRGHPLWVVGRGWRMAKELSVGARLHTVDGAISIESIDKTPDAEAFNLVVADFHTYFVGDRKVLVHDNNIRDGASALLPGLAADP
jgi:Pretoxin HINT domain